MCSPDCDERYVSIYHKILYEEIELHGIAEKISKLKQYIISEGIRIDKYKEFLTEFNETKIRTINKLKELKEKRNKLCSEIFEQSHKKNYS